MSGTMILLVLYFAPTIVAVCRGAHTGSVAVVNVLFGWTFIGWGVALAMAAGKSSR